MESNASQAHYRFRFMRKLNNRGSVTIPCEIGEVLGIDAGDIVEIQVVRVIRARPAPTHGPSPT